MASERTHEEIDLEIALGVLGEYTVGHDRVEVALSRVQEGVTRLRTTVEGTAQERDTFARAFRLCVPSLELREAYIRQAETDMAAERERRRDV